MKERKGRFRFIICIILLVVFCVLGYNRYCINTKSEPKTSQYVKRVMTLWAWGDEADIPFNRRLRKMISEFNKHNKYGVRIEVTIMKVEQYKTKIAAEVAANNAPDIFMIWPSYLKTYANAGKVYPLSNYFDKDKKWEDRYVNKNIFSLVSFDEEIYALPVSIYVTPLYYNKAIFSRYNLKVPKTYEALKTVVKVLTSKNITPFAFGNKEPWQGALFDEVIQNRIGGNKPYLDIVEKKGKWTEESFIKAARVMLELKSMGAFPADFANMDNDASVQLFSQGRAAMMVMGTWASAKLNERNSLVRGKIGLAKFPSFKGGAGNTDTWIGAPDQCIAVSMKCKYKDAAISLLKMLSNQKYQIFFSEVSGNLPVVDINLNDARINPLIESAIKLTKNLKNMSPAFDVDSRLGVMGNQYNEAIRSILLGKSPEEAFHELQDYFISNEQ